MLKNFKKFNESSQFGHICPNCGYDMYKNDQKFKNSNHHKTGEYRTSKPEFNGKSDDYYGFREIVNSGDLETAKKLIEEGSYDISTRRYIIIKWAAEFGKIEFLKYILDQYDGHVSLFKEWIHWAQTSDRMSEEDKKTVLEILKRRAISLATNGNSEKQNINIRR